MKLTRNTLKKILHYNPETGIFTRRASRNSSFVGKRAGSRHKSGYIRIKIGEKSYKAHRLAFLYMTGHWPKHIIDHINQDPSDNRWDNLRAVNHSQNGLNSKISKNNRSGYTGVSWHKQKRKWQAHIRIKGKRRFLGYFTSIEKAYAARQKAESNIDKTLK